MTHPNHGIELLDLRKHERTEIGVHIPRGARKRRGLCRDRSASVLSPVGLQHLPEARQPENGAATGVERVYFLALMELVAHFHLWLVPKKNEGELRGVDYLAQQPPLTASHSAAEAMSRKIRAELEPS
jgi:hypothetical protein